jgi:hypothetical protein
VGIPSPAPGRKPALAAFWPHNGAQRRHLLRIAEQHHTSSLGVGAGSGCACIFLRIRRLGVRVPPSAPRSATSSDHGTGRSQVLVQQQVQQLLMTRWATLLVRKPLGSACRGVVSLSLAGPGSDYVRRDDTAGGLGASRSCYARYGNMVLPAGPEEARTFWATRGVGRLRTAPPRAGRRRDEFWPLRSGLQRPALAIVASPQAARSGHHRSKS